jgi:hypothetical protein
MDQDILEKFDALEKKVDSVFRSVEKTRKYFQWTLIITAVMVVLPLIGLLFAIPSYLSTLSSLGAGF